MQTRAVDLTQVAPRVLLNDGTRIDMQFLGNNTWSGSIQVPVGSEQTLFLEWIETIGTRPLRLATWQQTLIVGANGVTINLGAINYDFSADFDADGISNLSERENNTDPFINDNDSLVETPDIADTNRPVDNDSLDDLNDALVISDLEASENSGDAISDTEISVSVDSDNIEFVDTLEETTSKPEQENQQEVTMGPADSPALGTGFDEDSELDSTENSDSPRPVDPDDDSDSTVGSDLNENSESDDNDESDNNSDSAADPITDDQTETELAQNNNSNESAIDLNSQDASVALPSVIIPRIAPSQAPVIDGLGAEQSNNRSLINEWAAAVQFDRNGEPLAFNNLMIDVNADSADQSNLRNWSAMHDGEYLFILVLSDDIGRRQSDSNVIQNDDSLELYFDGNNSKLSTWGDVDDFSFLIPLLRQNTSDPNYSPEGHITRGTGSELTPVELVFHTGPGMGPDGIRVSRWELDVYEFKIKLADVGIRVGQPFGFEIQINDDDNGMNRDSKWGWFHPSRVNNTNTDRTILDPSVMGTVVLE